MLKISFHDRFGRGEQKYLGTVEQGKEDFPLLDATIKASPDGETILFDISGFELFGYSYAKQTIRKVLLKAKAGQYGNRYFLVYARSEFETDDLSDALSQKKVAMLCSSSKNLKLFYDRYFVIGELADVYRDTQNYIVQKVEVTSGQMQKALNLESVQTASKRISKLAEQRLVRWEAMPSRERNVLLCKRIE